MNTVYDLLLNFQEEAFAFYEWEKEDTIEHIKRIPMVRISSQMLYDMMASTISIDQAFLKKIYRLTEKYDLQRMDYVCLFTDGNMALAVEFKEDGEEISKSRLLLEDEEEIMKYVSQEEEEKIFYVVLSKKEDPSFFTRKEKRVRHFLTREVIYSYEKKEYSKLRYLYLEYFNASEKNYKKMKEELLHSMDQTLNKKHFQLYELLLLLTKKKV